MSEVSIVAVRPKAISVKDKKVLAAAGVIVVEMDEPETLRFLKPNAELDGSDMLLVALEAMQKHSDNLINAEFVRLLHATMVNKLSQPSATPSR